MNGHLIRKDEAIINKDNSAYLARIKIINDKKRLSELEKTVNELNNRISKLEKILEHMND